MSLNFRESGDVDIAAVDASQKSSFSFARQGSNRRVRMHDGFMVRSTESDVYRVLSLADHVDEYHLAFSQLGR